jgi:hypothetical protein
MKTPPGGNMLREKICPPKKHEIPILGLSDWARAHISDSSGTNIVNPESDLTRFPKDSLLHLHPIEESHTEFAWNDKFHCLPFLALDQRRLY